VQHRRQRAGVDVGAFDLEQGEDIVYAKRRCHSLVQRQSRLAFRQDAR